MILDRYLKIGSILFWSRSKIKRFKSLELKLQAKISIYNLIISVDGVGCPTLQTSIVSIPWYLQGTKKYQLDFKWSRKSMVGHSILSKYQSINPYFLRGLKYRSIFFLFFDPWVVSRQYFFGTLIPGWYRVDTFFLLRSRSGNESILFW